MYNFLGKSSKKGPIFCKMYNFLEKSNKKGRILCQSQVYLPPKVRYVIMLG